QALGTEDPLEQLVGKSEPDLPVVGELAPVVLREGAGVFIDRLDPQAITDRRALAADARHELFHDTQLVESGPFRVALAPIGFGLQPYREGLREILCWMRLRVPLAEVMHIPTTSRAGLVL